MVTRPKFTPFASGREKGVNVAGQVLNTSIGPVLQNKRNTAGHAKPGNGRRGKGKRGDLRKLD